MSTRRQLMQAAADEGLLPANASASLAHPSWIVVGLGYVGALLLSLLGLGLLALLSWGVIFEMPGSLLTSLVLTAVGIALLRMRSGLFSAQIAFSILLIGQMMWLFSWGRSWMFTGQHSAVMPLLGVLALQLIAAWLTSVVWVQQLLGLIAGWTFLTIPFGIGQGMDIIDLMQSRALLSTSVNLWVLLLAWALWCAGQPRLSPRPRAQKTSALADGVGVALLFAPLSGLATTVLGLGAALPVLDAGQAPALFHFSTTVAIRMALVLASAWWLLAMHWNRRTHPGVRASWPMLCLAYAALLLACWFMPADVPAVVGTIALGTGRKRLLWLAGAVLVGQLSRFYYLLHWPLADKALLLAGMGGALALALGALHLLTRSAKAGQAAGTSMPSSKPLPPGGHRRWAPIVILAGALLAVGMVHWDARQKEQLIAQGQKIFVALAPVDPRSLMQGDYMALNFDWLPQVREQLSAASARSLGSTLHVAARLDARGVARIERLVAQGEYTPQGDLLLPVKYLKGRWVLVTDAYFFPEGQGQRFSKARFGEFRVLPGGRALLVGLADDKLQAIAPLSAKEAAEGAARRTAQEPPMEDPSGDDPAASAPPASTPLPPPPPAPPLDEDADTAQPVR